MRLAILADDLTGALDAGAPFAQFANRVEVWLGPPRRWPRAGWWVHAVAATTETRHTEPSLAAARAIECAAALWDQRPERFFKKIDSTLRGPWVEELDGVRGVLGERPVVVCPAFPEQGRVVRRGVVYERDRSVGDCLAMLCERMTPRRGRILHLPAPDQEEIATRFRQAVEEDAILVCDAESSADLRAVAACAATTDAILCGSAGLARAHCRVDGCWTNVPLWPVPRAEIRRVGVVVGSCHDASRRQLAALCATGVAVDILATPDPTPGVHPDPRRVKNLARRLLDQHFIVRFDALVLTGGETAAAVLEVLKSTRLELIEEIEPGIPMSRILDGHAPGALCITKAGGFGDEETLVRIANWISGGTADDAE